MENIVFDVMTNTITIPKYFYQASKEFGSEEQKILSDIQKQYPNMTIAVKTANRKNKKNDYKGLTYKYMRHFINVMDKGNLVNFEETIYYYERYGYDNVVVYKHVRDWFLEQYPLHAEMVVKAAPKSA